MLQPIVGEFADEVAALETKFRDAPTGQIVFYGSSSMRLWPHLERDFPAVALQNFGFGGSTIGQCAEHFERLIAPRRPRALVIYAGENDLVVGDSPAQLPDSLRRLLAECDAHLGPIPLAFLAIKPSPARLEMMPDMRQANQGCRDEIEARPDALWIDTFAAMLDGNNLPRRELYAGDALHLSRAGYEVWRQLLLREVPWLGE